MKVLSLALVAAFFLGWGCSGSSEASSDVQLRQAFETQSSSLYYVGKRTLALLERTKVSDKSYAVRCIIVESKSSVNQQLGLGPGDESCSGTVNVLTGTMALSHVAGLGNCRMKFEIQYIIPILTGKGNWRVVRGNGCAIPRIDKEQCRILSCGQRNNFGESAGRLILGEKQAKQYFDYVSTLLSR